MPKLYYVKLFSLLFLIFCADIGLLCLFGQRFFPLTRIAFVMSVMAPQPWFVSAWAAWLAGVVAYTLVGNAHDELALLLFVAVVMHLVLAHALRTRWVLMVVASSAMVIITLGGHLLAGELSLVGLWTVVRLIVTIITTCIVTQTVL